MAQTKLTDAERQAHKDKMIALVQSAGFTISGSADKKSVRLDKEGARFTIYVGPRRTYLWNSGARFPELGVRSNEYRKIAWYLRVPIPGDEEWNKHLAEKQV